MFSSSFGVRYGDMITMTSELNNPIMLEHSVLNENKDIALRAGQTTGPMMFWVRPLPDTDYRNGSLLTTGDTVLLTPHYAPPDGTTDASEYFVSAKTGVPWAILAWSTYEATTAMQQFIVTTSDSVTYTLQNVSTGLFLDNVNMTDPMPLPGTPVTISGTSDASPHWKLSTVGTWASMVVKYGDFVYLTSLTGAFSGYSVNGYRDITCQALNKMQIATISTVGDRTLMQIISADGKKNGLPVLNRDKIYMLRIFNSSVKAWQQDHNCAGNKIKLANQGDDIDNQTFFLHTTAEGQQSSGGRLLYGGVQGMLSSAQVALFSNALCGGKHTCQKFVGPDNNGDIKTDLPTAYLWQLQFAKTSSGCGDNQTSCSNGELCIGGICQPVDINRDEDKIISTCVYDPSKGADSAIFGQNCQYLLMQSSKIKGEGNRADSVMATTCARQDVKDLDMPACSCFNNSIGMVGQPQCFDKLCNNAGYKTYSQLTEHCDLEGACINYINADNIDDSKFIDGFVQTCTTLHPGPTPDPGPTPTPTPSSHTMRNLLLVGGGVLILVVAVFIIKRLAKAAAIKARISPPTAP